MANNMTKTHLISLVLILLMQAGSFSLSAQETRDAGQWFTGDCNYVWRQAVPGNNIGKNSIHAGDYDGDGNMEIICGASAGDDYRINYWYKLEYVPERESFDQVWVSPFYNDLNGALTVIEVLDIDGDGHAEILTGNTRAEVCVYDAVTMNPKGSFVLPSWDGESVYSIVFADADNDGSPDLVCCTDIATYFMDPIDFSIKGKIWIGANSMKCGNVDADPELELVYSNGMVLQVGAEYNFSTWKFHDVPLNRYPVVSLFDIDSDGMDEIYFVNDSIWVYDASLQTVKMILTHDWYDFDAVHVADMDLDGTPEIYAGSSSKKIIVFDPSGLKTGDIHNLADGVTGFVTADLNGDGTMELMWGAGNHSTDFDYLVIYNPIMKRLVWKSPGLETPFTGVKTADIDGDGNNEIITISKKYNSSIFSNGPIITILDAATHKIKWQSPVTLSVNAYYGGNNDFVIADVDHDGDMELIQISDLYNDARLWTFGFSTLEIESNHFFPELERFNALEIIDADNNGELEYVVAGKSHLYFINPSDHSITWTSPDMNLYSWPYKVLLFIGNIDADSNKEIVWLTGESIFIFDALTKEYKQMNDRRFSSICLYDYDRDGISEIIAGTNDGRLAVIDGQTLEVTWLPLSLDSQILSLRVFDVPGKETPVFALILKGLLYFTDASGNMFPPIILPGSDYEMNYDIEITDYDDNGISEIFVTYNEMITEFSAASFMSVGLPPKKYTVDGGCSVIPNPSNGLFKVVIPEELTGPVSAIVYSMQGSRVATTTFAGSKGEIDLGGFPSGIYLLHLNSGHRTYHVKLVKH